MPSALMATSGLRTLNSTNASPSAAITGEQLINIAVIIFFMIFPLNLFNLEGLIKFHLVAPKKNLRLGSLLFGLFLRQH